MDGNIILLSEFLVDLGIENGLPGTWRLVVVDQGELVWNLKIFLVLESVFKLLDDSLLILHIHRRPVWILGGVVCEHHGDVSISLFLLNLSLLSFDRS